MMILIGTSSKYLVHKVRQTYIYIYIYNSGVQPLQSTFHMFPFCEGEI